jgi:hypothetical protein
MTEANDDTYPHKDLDREDPNTEVPSPDDRATSLRGPAPVSVGRRFWLLAGVFGLVVFAVVLVVSFLSVSNDNARIDRLKTHGIPVTITVTSCIGNIGGSGSNSAGYTCRGDYTVNGATYREIIGSMATFSATGTTVRGVVDPSHHGTVVLSSALRNSSASPSRYVAPGLLGIALVALTLALRRVARRAEDRIRT